MLIYVLHVISSVSPNIFPGLTVLVVVISGSGFCFVLFLFFVNCGRVHMVLIQVLKLNEGICKEMLGK